ncbi:MAG: sirohydrochlorin cobaltochelatase [Desulfovibrionaceae bacterium]|nr:sirohydrochlorin cobaltochelatase [Desulfovibrionaceae bacterium]
MFNRLCIFVTLCLVLLACNESLAKTNAQVKVREGIVLAAFGTSIPEAKASFIAIEKAFQAHFKDTPIVWTYTSQIIRKKLAAQGEHILGIEEALAQLAKAHVKVVRIQPLHVLAGEEYTELERAVLLAVQKQRANFDAVYIGRPLLESVDDATIVAKALLHHTAAKREAETALVLMGHGQAQGRAGLAFEGVRSVFAAQDANIYMATVEGKRDFTDLLAELKAHGVRKVLLQPLMVVAGDHARNDLAGPDADSWASQLKACNITVSVNLEGLGVIPEVAGLYIQHAAESSDDLMQEPKKK